MVLREKRFQFKTPQATAAYQLASTLRENASTHISLTENFVIYLTTELRKCFVTTHKTKLIILNMRKCGGSIIN